MFPETFGREYRELLRAAVQHRLRERGERWHALDVALEKRANGARARPQPHR